MNDEKKQELVNRGYVAAFMISPDQALRLERLAQRSDKVNLPIFDEAQWYYPTRLSDMTALEIVFGLNPEGFEDFIKAGEREYFAGKAQ